MPETKVRVNGQVQLPRSILARYGLKRDDVLEVRDTGLGIVIIPERIKRKMAKERIFELVKKEWAHNRWTNSATLDRAINRAVRNVRDEERERLRAGV
jgi:bifunctional DNA-binding transcriptional regulator/antitoxin component of YhaV-PrlF toxin-antitoxin module